VPVRLREEVQALLRRGDGELNLQPKNTLSIFLMIRSAHRTAAETMDSVLGLERQSNRSSVVFR
jgi:hypothetical protein